jgi:hypothetical protein
MKMNEYTCATLLCYTQLSYYLVGTIFLHLSAWTFSSAFRYSADVSSYKPLFSQAVLLAVHRSCWLLPMRPTYVNVSRAFTNSYHSTHILMCRSARCENRTCFDLDARREAPVWEEPLISTLSIGRATRAVWVVPIIPPFRSIRADKHTCTRLCSNVANLLSARELGARFSNSVDL